MNAINILTEFSEILALIKISIIIELRRIYNELDTR